MELIKNELQIPRQIEEGLWITKTRYDRAWMKNILAEDFFEFGRSGRIYSQAECLDISGDAIDAVIPLTDFKARYLSENVVQITYKSIVNYNSKAEYSNRSSIWLKTSDGWKLKFHQGTPLLIKSRQ